MRHHLRQYALLIIATLISPSISQIMYEKHPLDIGVEIRGIDLSRQDYQKYKESLKNDITDHSLLVIKNQSSLQVKRFVEIAGWFGNLEEVYKHEGQPHKYVTKITNFDEKRTRLGQIKYGWHVDGTIHEKPNDYVLFHVHQDPLGGDTLFVNLTQIINNLSDKQRKKWSKLSSKSNMGYPSIKSPMQPLIYTHPKSKRQVLCFDLRFTTMFYKDSAPISDINKVDKIVKEIYNEINKNKIFMLPWTNGDLAIIDNLAVGHVPTEDSQKHMSLVGRRVLHRIDINGSNKPSKQHDEL